MANILIVDDEESIRVLFREFLSKTDYRVAVAEDASVAMRMLEEENFDVVVTDIILPKITGIGLLKSIKKVSPNVRVILMTGEPTIEIAFSAMRAGAFDFLVKPINKESLLRAVANATKMEAFDEKHPLLGEKDIHYQENLEQKMEEQTMALRRSEELLRETSRMTKTGGWEHDLVTDEVSWTDEVYRIFELPLTAKPPRNKSINLIHPEDRQKSQEAIRRAVEHGESFEMELRSITAKGKHLWTNTICKPVVVDGKVVKLSGILQDVTERKQVEENLARTNAELEQQITCLNESAIVAITDPKGNITSVNDKFCINSGFSREELIGINYRSLRSGHHPESFYVGMWDKLNQGKVWQGEVHFKKKDGTGQWLDTTIMPFKDIEGNIIKHVSVRFDITEKKELISALEATRKLEVEKERLKTLVVEKELEVKEEGLKVLKATMRTVHDIVGNFLNQLLLFKMEAEDKKALEPDSLELMESLIDETSVRLQKLGDLNTVEEKKMAGGNLGIKYDI